MQKKQAAQGSPFQTEAYFNMKQYIQRMQCHYVLLYLNQQSHCIMDLYRLRIKKPTACQIFKSS